MKQVNLERLSTDDLWALHAKVSEVLGQRAQQEKLLLEERLRQLRVHESGRRPYLPVVPKYFNTDHPSETWAGRGKQPHWVAIKSESVASETIGPAGAILWRL